MEKLQKLYEYIVFLFHRFTDSWITIILSTILKTFPHREYLGLLLATMFFKLTTETTTTTTTVYISYQELRIRIEEKSFVFFNGIAF